MTVDYAAISRNNLEWMLKRQQEMGHPVGGRNHMESMRRQSEYGQDPNNPREKAEIDALRSFSGVMPAPDLPGDIKEEPEDDDGDWLMQAARRGVRKP